jgi:hypothetical protein
MEINDTNHKGAVESGNTRLPAVSPKRIQAKAHGYSFTLEEAEWTLDKNVTIPVGEVGGLLDAQSHEGYLHTLAHYASNMSAGHSQNIFWRFLHMLRATDARQISDVMLINYKSILTPKTEWYLGTIRGFLKTWQRLGYLGVSKDVVDLLEGWTIKGNRKGDAVKRLDPTSGPLTDTELSTFNEGAVQAFELESISLSELAMCLATSHSGRRPIQTSHLRVMDVIQGKNKKGEPFYILNYPRGKQQGEDFRGSFKPFAVSQELWAILSAQVKNAIALAEKALGFELQEADRQQIPLFPDIAVFKAVTSPKELRSLFKTDKLHIPAIEVTRAIQYVVEVMDTRSERTGEPLHVNASRFRYTTGTRAAREGFGEAVIAELLDHSDTQNAGIYVKNIPEHVKSLDAAVGFQLAPYAQAFAGVLVDSEEQAKRGNDLASRIRTEEGEGAGTCGEHGFCGANVPIPCYTCMHFQPWLDGPHEEVYHDLLDERERVKDITGDIEIVMV